MRFRRLNSQQLASHLSFLMRCMGDHEGLVTVPVPGSNRHVDATAGVVFAKQLEYVEKTLYEFKYSALKGREIIPVSYDLPSGARSGLYRMLEGIGEAQLIADFAQDFPTVDATGREFFYKVVHFGDSYNYSIQELREAAMAGVPLQNTKAGFARRALEMKLDLVSAVGFNPTVTGVYGIANNPNVPVLTTLVRNWSNAATTGDSIFADLMIMWNAIYTNSPDTVEADYLATSPEVAAVLNSKMMNTFDRRTVAKAFAEATPVKTITGWTKLRAAGVGGTPRLVMGKKDKEVAKLEIPQEFEQTAPLQENMAFKVACHLSTAGVIVQQPLAMAYADNPLAP